MAYTKVKGIIIKEINTGEADKIVTILSGSLGKIKGYAKAARRPKNRLVAGSQLLCYSEFVLFKAKDMFNISSCDVIESFYPIRNDIVKLTVAAHLIDITDDVIQEGQSSYKTLQLLLNTIFMLSTTDKSPELLARIFELRLLSILGYAPYSRGCIECGNDLSEIVSFSFIKCGLLCERCKHVDPSGFEISTGTAKAINHIVHAPQKELFGFELSKDVLKELAIICRRYLRDRFEKDYKKIDFLNNL